MAEYKTIFVDTEIEQSIMKGIYEPNGDQLARDVQAALVEKSKEKFELFSSTPILKTFSTQTFTSGVMLVFVRKR